MLGWGVPYIPFSVEGLGGGFRAVAERRETDPGAFDEGDLTDPATLAALDVAVGQLDRSNPEFGRYPNGELMVGTHATEVVRMTVASPSAAADG